MLNKERKTNWNILCTKVFVMWLSCDHEIESDFHLNPGSSVSGKRSEEEISWWTGVKRTQRERAGGFYSSILYLLECRSTTHPIVSIQRTRLSLRFRSTYFIRSIILTLSQFKS